MLSAKLWPFCLGLNVLIYMCSETYWDWQGVVKHSLLQPTEPEAQSQDIHLM